MTISVNLKNIKYVKFINKLMGIIQKKKKKNICIIFWYISRVIKGIANELSFVLNLNNDNDNK